MEEKQEDQVDLETTENGETSSADDGSDESVTVESESSDTGTEEKSGTDADTPEGEEESNEGGSESEEGEKEEEKPPEKPLTKILQAIVDPIPGAEPAGTKLDTFEDDDLLRIKSEIDKMTLISGSVDQMKAKERAESMMKREKGAERKSLVVGSGSDFEEIIRRSEIILTKKSKDLLVVAYLSVALPHVTGIKGFAEAIHAFELYIEHWWETGWPPVKKMRIRGTALGFALPKLKSWLDYYEPGPGDYIALEESITRFKAVRDFSSKEMGQYAPATSELLQRLEQLLRKAPKPAPKPVAKPATATTSASSSTTSATRARPIAEASSMDQISTKADVTKVVVAAGRFIRETDLTDPTGYRLLRVGLWSPIEKAPPDGVIPPPRKERMDFIRGALENSDPENTIKAVEGAMSEMPMHFWLDMQRITTSAMETAGEKFTAAREAVLIETALLLQKVPGLPKISFLGGEKFADMATLNWIENTVSGALGSGGGGGNVGITASEEERDLLDEYEEAKSLITGGNPANAVATLQDGIESDRSGKARFRRRFLIGMLCVQANQFEIAAPIFRSLESEIVRRKLNRWEPTLALDVWTNLYKCCQFLKNDADEAEVAVLEAEAKTLFTKICQVDARYGLALHGQTSARASKPTVEKKKVVAKPEPAPVSKPVETVPASAENPESAVPSAESTGEEPDTSPSTGDADDGDSAKELASETKADA